MAADVFGREAELQLISALLDGLAAGPAALVLAGEAGAGKTTLLRAGVRLAAERGITVLSAMPAPSDLTLAFAGLADLLEPCLPEVLDQLPAAQARALRVALMLEEAPVHSLEPRMVAASFRAAVSARARAGPVLLVVDDVQWLDPASSAAVGFAVRRLATEPVGVLCAHRTAGAELPLDLGEARLPVELVPVGALSLGALHRMLRRNLGVSFAHPTLRRVEAASGGNPFIALEIGRALLRRGELPVPNAPLPVTDRLSGLVSERLRELQPEVAAALHWVAVMPDAPADLYAAAGANAAALDAAVSAGVLEERAGRLGFVHPLLAVTVAGGIPPMRKRELHAAAAQVAQLPEERARHRALAAAGPSAGVAGELGAAGRAAAGRGAPAAAAELFGLAAVLTPTGLPGLIQQRQLDAARQLAIAGETRQARAALQRMIASAPPGPDRSDALAECARLMQDDLVAATSLLHQALAEAGDDAMRRARIRSALSYVWQLRGDANQAGAEAQLALPEAEAADSAALRALALARIFDLGLMRGEVPDERLLDQALELERSVAVFSPDTPPSLLAGMWHLHSGRLSIAADEFSSVLARAESEGVEYWRADALFRLSQVALKRGDTAQAAELAAASLEWAEQLELPHLTCFALHGCAAAALVAGDVDEAGKLAARGAELADSSGDPPLAVMHRALAGSIDLALGAYEAAAAKLRAVAGELHLLGVRPATQAIWADSVEAFAAVGELDEAAAVADRLSASARETTTAAVAARCRGVVAAARGDLPTALAQLDAAMLLHDRASLIPVERGRTLLALGAAQRRLQRRTAARATLAEAASLMAAAGARLWADRVRAEQARISGRAAGPADLTHAEQRVAELVTRGLTNRQVAAELFVTVRAVESTLTKTYAKLGVRSRTELAIRLRGS